MTSFSESSMSNSMHRKLLLNLRAELTKWLAFYMASFLDHDNEEFRSLDYKDQPTIVDFSANNSVYFLENSIFKGLFKHIDSLEVISLGSCSNS